MPKLKPHRGVKKRIKITGSGKLLRRHAFGNHNLEKKQPSRKRRIGREYTVHEGDQQNVKRMLGV